MIDTTKRIPRALNFSRQKKIYITMESMVFFLLHVTDVKLLKDNYITGCSLFVIEN